MSIPVKLFLLVLLCSLQILIMAQLKADNSPPKPPVDAGISEAEFSLWKKTYNTKKTSSALENISDNGHLNELILSRSPYLLQHASNPINWKPWSKGLLASAKEENKLIFLSIGYSTCHWCHVMAEESFSQISVAKAINKQFIAIKVDREEMPDIDGYYMRALQLVKREAGWPITAIINSEGLPVFIDSYLTKEKLLKLLPKVAQLWQQQPEFLLSSAQRFEALSKQSQTKGSKLISVVSYLNSINQKLIQSLDTDYGGFEGKVKFPSEAMLLYAIDQLQRKAHPQLQVLVKQQLDNMMEGGLYDHVGGGFFRYSTDKRWLVPHFEKMLYNQAQLIMVYSRAYDYFHDPKYLKLVADISDSMVDGFFKKERGFISALNADFDGEEGGYYLWTSEQIDEIAGKDNQLEKISIVGSNRFGILLPEKSTQQIQTNHTKIRASFLNARQQRGELFFDNKVLTGLNGLAIKALVITADQLQNDRYLSLATAVAERLWQQRFDPVTGELNRTQYDMTAHGSQQSKTQSAETFYLEDYALLADALIALYDQSADIKWLKRAATLQSKAIERFAQVENKTARLKASDKKTLFQMQSSDDSEVFPAIPVFVQVESKLKKRILPKLGETTRNRFIENLLSKKTSLNHLYSALVLNEELNETQSKIRYFAKGHGKVILKCTKIMGQQCSRFRMSFTLNQGWHINANKPLQDYLIATDIKVPTGVSVDFPKSKIIRLGFQKEPLSLYDGRFEIRLSKQSKEINKLYLQLPLQACNDRMCLLPEQLEFTF